MNPQTVAACLAIIAAFAWYSKRKKAAEDEPQYYDAAELIPAIETLHELSQQLQNADALICDLSACNPTELLRGFRTQWQGLDGKRRTIDFLANGANGATAGLMQAAQESRDEVNARIIDVIRTMCAALNDGEAPAILLDGVEKSVDETSESCNAGEW